MSTRPRAKDGGKSKDSREDRLKAALKANLGRRKAQARAKAAEGDTGQDKSE